MAIKAPVILRQPDKGPLGNSIDLPTTATFTPVSDGKEAELEAPQAAGEDFESAVKMAFIGAGQGGGRIAEAFWNCGYRRVVAINTTDQDLSTLQIPDDHKLTIGNNRGGAGKDPEQGRLAAEESFEDIMDMLMRQWGEGVEMLYVCVGAGGGSGTGSWPVVARAIREYAKSTNVEKPIYKHVGVIMSLPKRSEGSRVQQNASVAVEHAIDQLAKGNISSLILVDNARIHELFPGLPVKKFWSVANHNFAAVLHTFNLLAAKNSEYNTFDKADFRSVVQNGIMIFGMTEVKDWKQKDDISRAVRQNLKGTLLAEGFDLSTANVAGVIAVAHDDILTEIPMENIDYAFNSLARTLGNENVTLHNGIYEGSAEGLRVFTIISGLKPPQARLDELKGAPQAG
jgi:cell division protein FtsZ